MAIGSFCLVLHGHLPWVLHHGRWPHGEDWLFEAASETWMPLIDVLDQCEREGIEPGWTLGLTPVLLEQLAHPRFRDGFEAYLADRRARAEEDAATFDASGEAHLAWLARDHAARFERQARAFTAIGRNIPARLAKAAGVEILTSNATHGFHPLLLHDASARAQLRAGAATSARHLGRSPRGTWLPECAYMPGGWWVPPVVHGDPRERTGVATLLGEVGSRFFFVDSHLVQRARPIATVESGRTALVAAPFDPSRCWNSVLEPHVAVERGVVTDVAALARCPDVSEQVWSGKVGYPGDGRYLEFHKMHGMRGLKYWRVTGGDVDLGSKELYYPDQAAEAVYSQAQHFVSLIRDRLRGHAGVGRHGVVVAPFDAELFGHWWHEGPAFLLEVARILHHADDIHAATVTDHLEAHPPDKAAELPHGTWGAGGDSRVWFNDDLRFYWELAYKAEDRFLELWRRAPWRKADQTEVRAYLTAAARELLLLQSSDWPFVISTRGAVDYGLRRIMAHFAAFDDLCNGVDDLLADREVDPVVVDVLHRSRLVDDVFPDLDLNWWG